MTTIPEDGAGKTKQPYLFNSTQQPNMSIEPTTARTCLDKLQGMETKSSESKRQLMQSIADDICATFMKISEYAGAGTLRASHTEPIDNVVRVIRDTDVSFRRSLEQRVRRLRKEKRWLRREYRKVVRSTETLSRTYKERILVMRHRLHFSQKNLVDLRAEHELLRAWSQNRGQQDQGRDLKGVEKAGDDKKSQSGVDGENPSLQ
ncbi:hypothetical protein NUU61_008352 [Penicillium alfredii]|uniref:Uncharacterized protein n=1 Tax=Penicillium alfredii TaxID=1506179 RepID=A0A9W9JZB5_9EURO|nr:uncharacterized protein NUU61_008352 [Penicillium alfredii]KAJ5087045.1 hypothetical protein NUU61_008352 [Penicillium alfredii]